MITVISVAKPPSASSTELSTTSYTRWWRPISPVEPIYMAGRRRTASSPSSTLILLESYTSPAPGLTSFGIVPYCPEKTSDSHRHDDVTVYIRDALAGRPISPVEPIYIAGRRRTASSPSSTLILLESYTSPAPGLTSFGIVPYCPEKTSDSHRHDDVTVYI